MEYCLTYKMEIEDMGMRMAKWRADPSTMRERNCHRFTKNFVWIADELQKLHINYISSYYYGRGKCSYWDGPCEIHTSICEYITVNADLAFHRVYSCPKLVKGALELIERARSRINDYPIKSAVVKERFIHAADTLAEIARPDESK